MTDQPVAEKKLSSEDGIIIVAGPELRHDYALARRDGAVVASYPISYVPHTQHYNLLKY
jgi:hypothetical protein